MKQVVIALFLIIGVSSAECDAYRFVEVGAPYPPFCAQQFKGKRICSNRFDDNKVVIICFFTLGQVRSQKALIDLQDIYAKYVEKSVSVVGIVSGKADLQTLGKFLEVNGITFPILLDPERQIYGDFGVFVYPSTGIFAQNGKLQYYLPARRVNFKRRVEGYTRFLLGEISEGELDEIIRPPTDRVDPGYKKAENYYNFAKIYFKQGKLGKAKRLLDLSIESYDRYALSYSLYGQIHLREKAYRLGLEKFELALAIDPDLQEALTGRQLCLENLKKQAAD
jgi:peroxiredoxin